MYSGKIAVPPGGGGLKYRKREKTFMHRNLEALHDWHFDEESFEITYWDVFGSLNKNAHPFFIKDDVVEIPEDLFDKPKLGILGLMWDVSKYPLENFVIQNTSTTPNSIAVLKKNAKKTKRN
jgi:hypothetical protein